MRIVVRSDDAPSARRLQDALAQAGVEALARIGLLESPEPADMVVLDGCGAHRVAALRAAQNLAESPKRPLCLLVAAETRNPPPPSLEAAGVVDGWIASDGPGRLRARQIEAFARLAVVEDETRRRAITAEAHHFAVPTTIERRRLKALFIGAANPFFLALEKAIAAHGGFVAAAFSSFTGFDHLHDERFDAVVLNGAGDPATAIALCAALRRNANLHAMPTLVLTAHGDDQAREAAIERGAAAVLAESGPEHIALGWLFDAIRRERRHKHGEHALRTLRDVMGDARTGLFKRAPFEAHLDLMARDHHASGRALSMIALRVGLAHGAREAPPGVWRRGFAEIAALAARLARETDAGVCLGDDLLAFALPATDLTGAKRTAERIAAVCECTAFAAGEHDAGPIVFEQNAVELQPGESGAGLLARACAPFNLGRARA